MHCALFARTGLLSLLLMTAASPAMSVVIGEPDSSYISHFVGVAEPTPETHQTFRNYSSPAVGGFGSSTVPANLDVFPQLVFGGTNSWSFDVSLVEGTMRASVSGSSGLICGENIVGQIECERAPTSGQVLMQVGDRVYVDQEITTPTTATVKLAVDGSMSGPADGGVQVISTLRAFIDPFGDGLVADIYNSQTFGPAAFLLEEDVLLQPGQQWFDIEASLHLILSSTWLSTGVFTAMDFGHTALLDIVLPDGLTFQTESGFIGRAAAVPEPGSLASFGVGLISLAMLWRRRRPVVCQRKTQA